VRPMPQMWDAGESWAVPQRYLGTQSSFPLQ
jgi:hypothetical protein